MHSRTGSSLGSDGGGGRVQWDGPRGPDARVHGVRLVGAATSPSPRDYHGRVGAVGARGLEV